MEHENDSPTENRKIAVSYIRTASDPASGDNCIECQRANIEKVCQENGWTPEWYEDRGKGGLDDKKLPAWLMLKKRLNDPNVVALVVNDLSRISRRPSIYRDLLRQIDVAHEIKLIFANSGKQLDVRDLRMISQLGEIFQRYYDQVAVKRTQTAHQKAAWIRRRKAEKDQITIKRSSDDRKK